MIGDFLYQLTPRDVQVTPFAIASRRQFGRTLAQSVFIDTYSLPDGRLFAPLVLVIVANAGAAQTVSIIDWSAHYRGGGIHTILLREQPGVLNVDRVLLMPSVVWFDPRLTIDIRATATFSSNVNNNLMNSSLYGVTIPLGNVESENIVMFSN